jgi:Rrf2 family protein
MTKFIAISGANIIAFHSMALIAKSKTAINAETISEFIGASKHHASKVLQKLVKNEILGSTRGPSGGFYLLRPAEEIKMIEILEAIDGKVNINECPVDNLFCPFGNCLMGGICSHITKEIVEHLTNYTLLDMINNISTNKNIYIKNISNLK